MTVGAGGVLHVNVNCTDLGSSVAFYRDVLGMQQVTHTAPSAPQPGGAFGLESAQWDAWILGGAQGFARPVVDLLQWIVPPPALRTDPRTVGFLRLRVGAPGAGQRTLTDPDGTEIEVHDAPAGPIGVTVGCSDPARSHRFYRELLGLGDFVELIGGTGTAASAANTVGIWRMALATEDIDADVAALAAEGVPCLSDPVEMSMGPGLPVLRFVLFPDPDGTMLELIQRPAVGAAPAH